MDPVEEELDSIIDVLNDQTGLAPATNQHHAALVIGKRSKKLPPKGMVSLPPLLKRDGSKAIPAQKLIDGKAQAMADFERIAETINERK